VTELLIRSVDLVTKTDRARPNKVGNTPDTPLQVRPKKDGNPHIINPVK